MKIAEVKILRAVFDRRIKKRERHLISYQINLETATDVNHINELKILIREIERDLLAFRHYHIWLETNLGEEYYQKEIDEIIAEMKRTNEELEQL